MLVRSTSDGAVVFKKDPFWTFGVCGFFSQEQVALVLSETPIIYCDEKWLEILLDERVCYVRARHLRTFETGEEICL